MNDKTAGYIVIAVTFIGGEKGYFKIGCSLTPEPDDMDAEVFNGNNLHFLGRPLHSPEDDEDSWMFIPSTGYMAVSWRYYTVEELKERIAANTLTRPVGQPMGDRMTELFGR